MKINFKKIIIWLVGIYLGIFVLVAIPTLFSEGGVGNFFSLLVNVVVWALLFGFFVGLGFIVIGSIFSPNKTENEIKNEKESINDSDEVI